MNGGAPAKWPVIAGTYKVGDPGGPVAACTLTSERLVEALVSLPGVAIAGTVQTANLGIMKIIRNVISNPAIRFLFICGKDSPLFRPGQSIVALAEKGVDSHRRIINARGHDPVLGTITDEEISRFRKQVEVVDWAGEEDPQALKDGVSRLKARDPGAFEGGPASAGGSSVENFVSIVPGGRREPLIYDKKGYFVISVDREERGIVLRHYLPDHKPANEMRGHSATSMLLGLLREGLVTQLSHAGYLGEELAKAEAALALGVRYHQDRPLRMNEYLPSGPAPSQTGEASAPAPTQMSSAKVPMMLKELESAGVGSKVDVALEIGQKPTPQSFIATVAEPDEAEPFNLFHRSSRRVTVDWDGTTRMIMGEASDLAAGGVVRVVGPLNEHGSIKAEQIVILTKVAKVL